MTGPAGSAVICTSHVFGVAGGRLDVELVEGGSAPEAKAFAMTGFEKLDERAADTKSCSTVYPEPKGLWAATR